MRIIYEAFDGKQFDDETDCLWYENQKDHIYINKIYFFDKNNHKYLITNLEEYPSDDIYNEAEKIIVHNKEELNDLLWLSQEMGWCEFEQITQSGTWIREETNGNGYWIKV